MDKTQLRALIEETLKEIDLYSSEAVDLLMGTAEHESKLGHYILQVEGPALGIFQMEPATFRDIQNNYLEYKPNLNKKIAEVCGNVSAQALIYNMKLAICFARVHYLRVPKKLPGTIKGMAEYLKKYYNTKLGKGTAEQFIKHYSKYVLSE